VATGAAVEGRPDARVLGALRRPIVAGLVLLVAYVALSFLMSPRGFLGTDTGGKVATLEVMKQRGDLDPDVGYWAEAEDPTARVHGLFYTSRIGDRFINVTSLPMVLAAEPLYRVGGYRLALALPMVASVAAAFAARALARRIGSGTGWAAFWLVGLASPLTVYALDFWEHSAGVALMAWGLVALYDAIEDRPTWWRGLLAGVAFGAAFAMRNEAGVYALTCLAIGGLILLARRRIAGAILTGATFVAGFGLMYAANLGLESAVVGASLRSGRVSGTAAAGGGHVALRAKEAFVTLLSPFPAYGAEYYLLAVALAGGLAYLVWASSRRRDRVPQYLVAALVVVVVLLRASEGLRFVPGLVATTPIAVAGVVLGWRRGRSRLLVVMALVPLPLVFVFQFPGGALPQWAGRYILFSGFLLLVVGASHLGRLERWLQLLFIGLSVAVTCFGLAWLSTRSHAIATAADRLEQRDEPVLIATNGFLPREFGATYGRKNWLATGSAADVQFAVTVVGQAGLDRFGLVDDSTDPAPSFAGWQATTSDTVPLLGDQLRVTTYVRDEGA